MKQQSHYSFKSGFFETQSVKQFSFNHYQCYRKQKKYKTGTRKTHQKVKTRFSRNENSKELFDRTEPQQKKSRDISLPFLKT